MGDNERHRHREDRQSGSLPCHVDTLRDALRHTLHFSKATHTVAYTVNDGRGGTATATVTVTVTGLAEPPTRDTTIFISDICFESKQHGRDHRALVEVRDIDGNAVA